MSTHPGKARDLLAYLATLLAGAEKGDWWRAYDSRFRQQIPALESFFLRGLADNTHRVYHTGQKRYLDFCSRAGLRGVPASEGVVCKFVVQLATEGLKHRTIKSNMAGVRHLATHW